LDTSTLLRPRSRRHAFRGLAICISTCCHSRLSTLSGEPPRRPSRLQLSRFGTCRGAPVPILPFPPPFLAGTAGWRHLLRPDSTALLCFPATRDPPVSGPSQKDWPSLALAAQRIL